MVKVLFFLPNLHGGGAERVTVNIIRQMDKSKFSIKLVLAYKVGSLIELVPTDVEIIDLKSKKTMYSILKIREIVNYENPDVIYSSLFRMHVAIYFALIGIKKKPKIILRSPNSPKLLIKNGEMSFVMNKLLDKAYENANIIIAQTPEMKEEIIKYHAVEKEKIIVLINPIDKELINNSIKNHPNPFEKGYINVVAAGRLQRQKGFDILIKSFEDVIKQNNKFRLYIIGDTMNGSGVEKELLSLIKFLKLEEYIFLLGFKNNPYKYFYYSDLYVLSSRWEGLPNTILENLYLSKPIVSTRCIKYIDKLINNKNGILVEIEDTSSLAKAILNYKKIDTTYLSIDFNSSAIEDIFLSVMKEEIQ